MLVPHGFQAGQVGVGTDVGVTFCSPGGEFSRRFPHLASWMDLDHPAACVDLAVYAHPEPARLVQVRLEGRELDDVAGRSGNHAAGRADGVGLPMEEGLERLAATVAALLLEGSPHE